MKRIITSLIFTVFMLGAAAQTHPVWTWGHTNPNTPITINPDYVHQVVAAHEDRMLWCNILNNRYISNEQYGDYEFSEFDTSGNVVNSTTVTGKLTVVAADADQAGNWYVMAKYEDTVQFPGGITLIKDPMGSGICIFRLHASTLAVNWVKPVGDNLFCSTGCFTVGGNGVYFPVDSSDTTRICKMDLATGNRTTLWSQTGTGWTTAIKLDSKKNIYMTGTCASNNVSFNGHTVNFPFMPYIQYFVRYKADGTHDWSHFMQDATCFFREFTVADDNTIYYTGPLDDTMTLGNVHLHTPAGFSSFMVARLDSTGSFAWARQLSDTATGEATLTGRRHAVAGPDGSVMVYAMTTRFLDWGNGVTSFTQPGSYSGTVVSYDRNGTALWAKQITGDYIAPQQMAGGGNSVWVTGNVFDSTAVSFDQVSVPLPSGSFGYYPWVTRLALNGTPTSVKGPGDHPALQLAPNPAHDQFTLSGTRTGEKIGVRIISDLGQTVLRAEAVAHQQVSVSGFAPGLYFVELTVGTERLVKKLIVQ